MNGNGTLPAAPQNQIPVEAVVAVLQREFPTEFRVCVQQAYIEQLEARVRELSSEESGG